MKNLTTWFAGFVLSSVCLLTGAYGQLTPSQDAYTSGLRAQQNKNYGFAQYLFLAVPACAW